MATQMISAKRAQTIDRRFARETGRLNIALAAVGGLSMRDGYRGVLEVGQRQATVRFEPDQWIRVSLGVDSFADPLDALRVNHWLPGNLRYAGGRGGTALVADTQIDGVAHLPASLEEIRLGLADALGGNERPLLKSAEGKRPASLPGEPAQAGLEAALRRLPFGDDSLVRRDSADGRAVWEIRPRIRGDAVPVLLDHIAGGVRLHRTLLATVSAEHRDAVADQALRLNAQFRLCRLAWCGDALVVEALLHAGLMETCWLGAAAQAVAAAGNRAKDPLHVLARHAQAASWYRALLL